jgi:hypothetical protein
MRTILRLLAAMVLAACVGFPPAWAAGIDTWIANLKDKDPAVRAKAAFELGCT